MSVRSIRLSNRVWEKLQKAADRSYRTLNSQVARVIEDWLVEHGIMEDSERSKLGQ
ncbi:MAG: hypothetical protein ACE5GH_06225 [Fidelibacterota bacterium]